MINQLKLIWEHLEDCNYSKRWLRNSCLLDYPYCKGHHKIIATDLSNQQAFDTDPKAIQQFNVTETLRRNGDTRKFFINEEVKEAILDFSQETARVLKYIKSQYKMSQSSILNVELPNSQRNTWKTGIIKGAQVNLNLSSNVIGDSNDETNFMCKLLLTNTPVSRSRKAFANNLSGNIKWSKTHLSKMVLIQII